MVKDISFIIERLEGVKDGSETFIQTDTLCRLEGNLAWLYKESCKPDEDRDDCEIMDLILQTYEDFGTEFKIFDNIKKSSELDEFKDWSE